ncbi:collagen alpha-1(XI) chain-like [Pieris rapae]|uniref:collagen alpha-1(XI) chain-like n=1 Tax=Pieris rapae TaxID=64459 RepID=UPI001E27CFB2|nr:collagen alpha-1(XI) chain-like [Pieris rapae]
MVNVQILMFLVYSFQFVNGEAAESGAVTTTSQESPIPDESQAQIISAELRQCGLRITGPGLTWEKVDDCASAYADPTEMKGDQGLKGIPGVIGIQGLNGEPGLKGEPGPQGEKGDKGKIGEDGSGGEKGDRGSAGPKGVKGDQGASIPGLQGPPGEPGPYNAYSRLLNVELPKKDVESDVLESEARNRDPGTKSNPAKSCADIEADGITDGDYSLNPENEFTASCDFIKQSACLSLEYDEEPKLCDRKPCWLFKSGFNIGKFYRKQLKNIKYLSTLNGTTHSTHKITIICKYLRLSEESNLQIQLYHMLLIGPEASNETPLHYKVNSENCNSETDEGSAEIEITIIGPFLPITDFYIRDFNEKSELIFDKTEVCFYYK